MFKKFFTVLTVLFISILVLGACTHLDDEQPDGEDNEISQEERQERAEEEQELENEYSSMSSLWTRLKVDVSAGASDLVADLDSLQAEVAADLTRLRNATVDTWEDAKNEVSDSLDAFGEKLNDFEASLDADVDADDISNT